MQKYVNKYMKHIEVRFQESNTVYLFFKLTLL